MWDAEEEMRGSLFVVDQTIAGKSGYDCQPKRFERGLKPTVRVDATPKTPPGPRLPISRCHARRIRKLMHRYEGGGQRGNAFAHLPC